MMPNLNDLMSFKPVVAPNEPTALYARLSVDDANDGGVFFGVGVGNFAGVVLGAVVDKDDLGILACGEQGLDAMIHISSRVVARHGKGDEFHKKLLLKGIIYLL